MFQRIKNLASSVAQTIRPTSKEGTPVVSQADDVTQEEANEVLVETQPPLTTVPVEVIEEIFPSAPLPSVLSEKELEESETDKEETKDEDEEDQNPDSVYFQRNYLFNISALPLDNFETSDPYINEEKLQFLCRRKKIPPSSRLHEGSYKKTGKIIHFCRRVYVPPREVLELVACDGQFVWRGDIDFDLHNVQRFHKGDTWNIHTFNDLLEDALCFPDEHPGLQYILRSVNGSEYQKVYPSMKVRRQQASAKRAEEGERKGEGEEGEGGETEKEVEAPPEFDDEEDEDDDVKLISNLILEIKGSKELDDNQKNYLQDGALLALVVAETDQDVTPARFEAMMKGIVTRRFCSLSRAGNLKRAKRFCVRFNQWFQVDALEDDSGWCAFHFAAHGGHLPYLQWLLDELYAVPTQRARDKKNAVHIAVAAGHTEVVRWLFSLDCGFTLNDEYIEEETLLVGGVSRKSSKGAKAGSRTVLNVMMATKRMELLREFLGEDSKLAQGMYARHGVRGWITAALAEKAAIEEDAAIAAREEEERAQALALAASVVSESVSVSLEDDASTTTAATTTDSTITGQPSSVTASSLETSSLASSSQATSTAPLDSNVNANKKPTSNLPQGLAPVPEGNEAMPVTRPRRYRPMFFVLPPFKPPVVIDPNDATDSSRIYPAGDLGIGGMEGRIGATKEEMGDSIKLPGEEETKDISGSGQEGANGGANGDVITPLPTTTPVKSSKTTTKTTSSSSKPTTKPTATTKTPAGSSSSKPGGGGSVKPVPLSSSRDRSPPSVRPVQGKSKDPKDTTSTPVSKKETRNSRESPLRGNISPPKGGSPTPSKKKK